MKRVPPWWIAYIAALGGFLVSAGDFWGALTSVKDKWPSIVPLLPLVGTVVLLLLAGSGAYLGWQSVRDFRDRKRSEVLEFFDDLLSNLEIARYTDVEERATWLAKADVITKDLIRKGLLDSGLDKTKDFHQLVAYITYMRKVISHHGIRQAKREAAQARLMYSRQQKAG